MIRIRLLMFMMLLTVIVEAVMKDQGQDSSHQTEDWIDPFDMVNFDHSTKTMKKERKQQEKTEDQVKSSDSERPSSQVISTTLPTPTDSQLKFEEKKDNMKKLKDNSTCKKDDVGSVVLKKFLKQMVFHFKGKHPQYSSQEYNMWIHLTHGQIETLTKFGDTKTISIHDVDEVLSSMIQSITISHRDTAEKTSMWFEDKIGISLDGFLKVLAVITLATFLTWIEVNLQLSWRQRVAKLFILAFIISIPMTWYELYKAAEIQQQTVAMKDAPANCVKNADEKGWFDMVRGAFSFEKDECQEYYEHMMIDPLLKVPPTKAVAITFVRFFIAPLKDIGGSLSEFLRALFKDLPTTFYPVAIAVLSIVLFLFLFMWFGYSIRFPFFLGSIEPTYNVAVSDGNLRAAIEDNSKQLMEQMRALQNVVYTTDQTLSEKMMYLEKVQKAFIEYPAAASTASGTRPPTLPTNYSDSQLQNESQNVVDVKPLCLPSTSISFSSKTSDKIAKAKNTRVKSPILCTESTESIDIVSSSELACNSSETDSFENVIGPTEEEHLDVSDIRNDDITIETLQASSLSV